MTAAEREELLALVEAMPEANRQALLDVLRKLPPDRPMLPSNRPDGPSEHVACPAARGERKPSALRGQIVISEDFDTLPPDIGGAFGGAAG